MSFLTSWGYTLTGIDTIPDILTVEEFNQFTANKYANDQRVQSRIKSAQSAIRNYVGWHLGHNLECQAIFSANSNKVTFTNRDILIQLPAMFVTKIKNVYTVEKNTDKTEVLNFYPEFNGILTLFDTHVQTRYSNIEVDYMAGLNNGMLDDVKEIISNRVTHDLSQSYGIQSETSGGVSITYSSNWANSPTASTLSDGEKEILNSYRLQGVS